LGALNVTLTAKDSTELEVRRLIHQWMRVLATGDYDTAAEMVGPVGSVRYSGPELRACIGAYGRKYREAASSETRDALVPAVSEPSALDQSGERMTIYPAVPDGTCLVEYDFPLDGKWSDLTAVFRLTPCARGLELGLYDLRVM
jgi:hypothetical protein